MAKLSLMVKAERGSKFPVRNYTRCKACGRPRAYIGKFQLCRICFPELSRKEVRESDGGVVIVINII